MQSRILGLFLLPVALACQAASPSSQQTAEAMVEIVRVHFDARDGTRTERSAPSPNRFWQTEVNFAFPSDSVSAIYHVDAHGNLIDFAINGPRSDSYVPVTRRLQLLERLMSVAATDSSPEEREWGAKTLDTNWTQRVRPIPVQIGNYVFGGITVSGPMGLHDHITVVSVETGATGWKYQAQP